MNVHEVWVFINQIWQAIAPFVPFALIGGVITSVILETAKGWLIDPKHAKTVKFLKTAISIGVVAINSLLASAPSSAKLSALKALIVTASSSGLYTYILKPIYAMLSQANTTYKAGKTATTPDTESTPVSTFSA